ncbi:hypothetical protein KAW18_15605 [candidate division WOR-3 bacterium]|nr:hypothetical protein [candidate division WOR-3 bacterium]
MKNEKLTIEEYEELGEKVKEAHLEALDLLITISKHFPKAVYRRGFDKITRGFTLLKSDLDDRVFAEHREEPSKRLCNVFYGEEAVWEKMRNEEDLKGEQWELWRDLKHAIVPILKKWDIPGSSIGRWDLYEALGREVAKMGLEFLRQRKK